MEHEHDEADQQVVLEEEIDENYEPTDAEITEYAKWLGIDLENEQDLLWIAREGLKAPLPVDWKPCQAPSKEIYYFNFATGESIWDHPCDDHFRRLYQQVKARLHERQQFAGQQPEQQQQQHVQQPVQQQIQLQYQQGQQLQLQLQLQHQSPQPQQQQQQHQAHRVSDGAGSGTSQRQQQQPGVLQLQQNSDPASSSLVSQTSVEALQLPFSSSSGTMSTLPSATTSSIHESPVGGLASGVVSIFKETSSKGPSILAAAAPSVGNAASPAAPAAPANTVANGAVPADWQASADAADQEQRKAYRQRLEADRHLWEQQLQSDVHMQQVALQEQHRTRLWSLKQQLDEQEHHTVQQLCAGQDACLQTMQVEMQTAMGQHQQELQDVQQQHASRLAEVIVRQADIEAVAAARLRQAQGKLCVSALSDAELSAVRDKAAAAAEADAKAEVASKRGEFMKEATQRVEQEVAAEVQAYKDSRRAATFKELAGQLDSDTAAAAQKLEQTTAELQQLEATIAHKAAVVQKLNDQIEASLQQRDSLTGPLAMQSANSQQQLISMQQQQLQQGQKQLDAAHAAMTAQRAAIADAEAKLAAVKQDAAVCEPRLAKLQQQLEEVDNSIHTQEIEYQQRSADLLLVSRRLQELQVEAAHRKDQLDAVDSLYTKRQEALQQIAAELARRRGDLSTLEAGLSDTLRRQADKDFQTLEDQLRRTRKAAAAAASELASKQVSLSTITSQLAASQAQLEGVETTLAAKRKQLQDVMAQLHAAASQEFQEARLLESERCAMQTRVVEQIESERRATLAAARRQLEKQVVTQLQQEQAATLGQQQGTAAADSDSHGFAAMLTRMLRSDQQTRDSSTKSMPELRTLCSPAGSNKQRCTSLSPDRAARSSHILSQQQHGVASSRLGTADVSDVVEEHADGAAAALRRHLQALGARQSVGSADTGYHSTVLAEANMQWGTSSNTWQPTYRKASSSPKVQAYNRLLQQAKQFVKQKRRDIQQRQSNVIAAQADWKHALAAAGEQPQPHGNSGQTMEQLRQLKHALQDQVHVLNGETHQLKAMKGQVRQLQAYVLMLEQQDGTPQEQRDPAAVLGQQQPVAGSQFSSLGHLLTPGGSNHHKQQPSQQVPSGYSRSLRSDSSLDKVATALQHALDAAAGCAGPAAADRISSRKATANGVRSRHGRASSAWHAATAAVHDRIFGGMYTEDSEVESFAPSLAYLDKLREERDAAHGAMQEHSEWLKGFRAQVARVAQVQAADAGQQQRDMHQAVVDLGNAAAAGTGQYGARVSGSTLSPSASLASALATPRSGQPMTLDLGSQQLVISIVDKSM
eukprot:GHRR01020280.1.p1 GENE.GHRR01020280.1~~GHRR01020280.1.p1  ORF type:complete len:1326 (+),score=682.05 GHRR01020280.1:480-4457(+)